MNQPGKISGKKILFTKLDEAVGQLGRSLKLCLLVAGIATLFALSSKGFELGHIKDTIRILLNLEESGAAYPLSWMSFRETLIFISLPTFIGSYVVLWTLGRLVGRKQSKFTYKNNYKVIDKRQYHKDLKEWVFNIEKKLSDLFAAKRGFWDWFDLGLATATGGDEAKKKLYGKYITIGKEKAILTEKQLNLMTGIVGAPQTGKSSLFENTIPQLREKGYAGIVFDYNGESYAKFAEKDDFMWCPFDRRTMRYNLFAEKGVAPEQLTLAMIEDQLKNDKFWRRAGARVLADFMRITESHRGLDRLIKAPLAEQKMELIRAGMGAAQYLEETKLATSVKSNIEQDTQLLPYIDYNAPSGTPFSVYHWAKNCYRNWLFIVVPRSHRDLMRPWLRLFAELAIIGCFERKMYGSTVPTMFIGDEWPQIGYVPSFKELLSNGPKYNLSGMFGWHTDEQIISVYGNEAKEILSTVRTRAIFNPGDHPDSVKRAAKLLGEEDVSSINYSMSAGSKGSPSITAHVTEKQKFIVPENKLIRLQEFEFYLKSSYLRPIKLNGYKDPAHQPIRPNLDIAIPPGFSI